MYTSFGKMKSRPYVFWFSYVAPVKKLRVRHHFGSLDKVLADSGPKVNPQFDGCHAGFMGRRHYRVKTQHLGKIFLLLCTRPVFRDMWLAPAPHSVAKSGCLQCNCAITGPLQPPRLAAVTVVSAASCGFSAS